MSTFRRGSFLQNQDIPEVTSPSAMGQDIGTRDFSSFFSSPDLSLSPTRTSSGDSPISTDFFSLNKPRSSMIGRQSVPNYSSQLRQYAAQEQLTNLRRNSLHLPYIADRSTTNMSDFGNVSQTENCGSDIRNKNMQRPKLDLSFASYGYPIPQQQYRGSPTYSDGSDPLISHLMMGSRSNTPDDSDMSNSPETVADLINHVNINPYGSSPLTEQDLANMQRISSGRLSAGENIHHQTQNLLSSLLAQQSQYPTRYGSPATGQSPVYEKKSPPPFWSPTRSTNDNNNNQNENRNLNRNIYSGLHKDPIFTWSGLLPKIVHSSPNYSCKVFLGGVPWDITEDGIIMALSQFGSVKIEWPGTSTNMNQPKGYVYAIMQSDQMVKQLLESCTKGSNGGNYYFKISSRKMKGKEVQVIPWLINDSNCVKHPSQKLDPTRTVFVGALHGMMNAQGLFKIMDDLFGNVSYAGIDTDKYKYPIGSGRVTFATYQSYTKAVAASFIEVKTPKFCKKIQVDPYLEDSACSVCNITLGPYFCRDQLCYRYYCRGCWNWKHITPPFSTHRPLMRNSKHTPTSLSSPPRFTSPSSFSPTLNQSDVE
ncbi:RNA recognition motif domain,Cytoplasmic polyadenylation element-binding protein, ZZ domain [Cinara cedri]|uniref:RNA recognition motif domain,Cytoplasmic polyadenylation element-binding protein, ZZ domain n=1 Tax=Cinara cedri TaxID=506608 RepID=A0A5E4M2D4_9HEMI|nr:RNA recognition motif domain,Cytoplasmic polyadenylation element-binding protein, ZZ domain [Cinara cedri]